MSKWSDGGEIDRSGDNGDGGRGLEPGMRLFSLASFLLLRALSFTLFFFLFGLGFALMGLLGLGWVGCDFN